MDNHNFWFRTLFKLKIYESSGESFQRLFQDIMGYRYPNFQSIAPYGNQGDGGNDGWIADENRYFQVYGKKANSELKLSYVLKKSQDAFEELNQHWGEIKKYHFVYNDRFEGIPAPIGQALLALKQQQQIEEATVWGSKKLEQLFMELVSDQKESILGGVPAEIPDFIDARVIGDLLSYLADKVAPLPQLFRQNEPILYFDEKIKINGLTSPVVDYLRIYSYQTQEVDDFLNNRDVGLKQAIAEEMKSLYEESCQKIFNSAEASNMRYVWMIEQLIPPNSRKHPHSLKAYREATQVILAKYFESCDVYEHPSAITAS